MLDKIKVALQGFMHYDGEDACDEFVRQFGESPAPVIREVLEAIPNPLQTLRQIAKLVRMVIVQLQEKLLD